MRRRLAQADVTCDYGVENHILEVLPEFGEDLGMDFESVYVPGFSHATYYPDSKPIIMKYTVQKQTGKLLGAQAIGRDGVDKRIDVLSTAIYGNMTVFDL